MSNRFKNDNLGFSLVEIIIAVMIVSIISGVAGYGLSLSSGKPAEKCARNLSGALSHARTSTMGKYRNVITLTNTGSGFTMSEFIEISLNDDGTVAQSSQRSTTVGDKGVTVEYDLGTGYTTLNPNDTLNIRFDSGSGALKEPSVTKGELIFKISKAGTVKYVTITQLTGNITIS